MGKQKPAFLVNVGMKGEIKESNEGILTVVSLKITAVILMENQEPGAIVLIRINVSSFVTFHIAKITMTYWLDLDISHKLVVVCGNDDIDILHCFAEARIHV